jgi:hypothetical protein
MRNPYDDEQDLTEYRVSRRAALWISALFLLTLSLPPLGDLLYKTVTGQLADSPFIKLVQFHPAGDQKLQQHLSSIDRSLDHLPYAKTLRQQTQQLFTSLAGEGNRKVVLGRNGWLFYRPELQALNGWGPLQTEPFSVMKDPTLAQLKPAREWVLQFAADLKQRGIPLLLVPLPVKPMLYPEQLLNKVPDAPLYHPDQLAFYDELRRAGIDVLDLSQPLYDLKKRFPLFLKQDTHWTPEAMKKAASLVADHLKKTHPNLIQKDETPRIDARVRDRQSLGDLVQLLDLPHPESRFKPEPAQIVSIYGFDPDRNSPIALLGDSFVNIYTDPTLGFADPAAADQDSPPLMNAGFAYQLALYLGRPLDVIAKNGAGTTATRKELAARPDDEVRAKKLVIWVLAARDLIYSPAAARDANIEWGPAPFNPHASKPKADPTTTTPPSAAQIVVEAELIEKSANQDPNATPYADALHTAVYRVTNVISGEFDPASDWQAVQWTFKKKVLQPTAQLTPGKRYRLTLSPWDDQPALQSLNLRNDNTSLDEFTTERWYVEAVEELP